MKCFTCSITLIFALVCNAVCFADSLSLPYEGAKKITISGGGSSFSERIYYSTNLSNEIMFIIHYINSFDLVDDGKIIGANDSPSYQIKIMYTDRTIKYDFCHGRFFDISDNRQFALNRDSFYSFLETVEAIMGDEKIVDDNIGAKMSDWAMDFIAKSQKDNLLPMENQIGYKCNIDRLETARLIYNMLKNNNHLPDSAKSNVFFDTNDKSVNTLYDCNIVSGKQGNVFKPYSAITREDFSVMIYNAYKYCGVNENALQSEHNFFDSSEISDYALNAVRFVSGSGVMIGDENNNFRPKDFITKEEAISVIVRFGDMIKAE